MYYVALSKRDKQDSEIHIDAVVLANLWKYNHRESVTMSYWRY